jgi:hypothetical protein
MESLWSWLVLLVCTFLTVELFFRLPFIDSARRVIAVSRKSASVVASSKISDHWKEKVVPVYAGKLFVGSLQLFGWMILAFMPFIAGVPLVDTLGMEVNALLVSWPGLLVTTLVAVIYASLRNKLNG